MKKLEVTLKELKLDEVPQKMLNGISGGYLGKYQKEKGERTPSRNKPLILMNYEINSIALAKIRNFSSEEINLKKEVEYLVEHTIYFAKNSAYAIKQLIDYFNDK